MPGGQTESSAAAAGVRRRVARLFHRAAFGATVEEIDRWATLGYAAAVDHLLAFPPAAGRPDDAEVLALDADLPVGEIDGFDLTPLQRWWLTRMADTAHPLEEKLTLYWHGHFATAFSKVRRPRLMIRQNRLLRHLAGGGFGDLCREVTGDAAMLIWLDGDTNHVGVPNENYAREFMELFTLGKDRYTQEDVRQAARAFTGYTVDGQGNPAFRAELNDGGEKTILGNTAPWRPMDMPDLALDHHPDGEVAAHFVVHRLASFLHHPHPEPDLVAAMAGAFTASGHQIKPMVRALLTHPAFTDGPVLNVKSPAELVAGATRALDLAAAPQLAGGNRNPQGARPRPRGLDELARACGDMGQQLFNPPNVAGWKGGGAWANTATVLARYNFAAKVAKVVGDDAAERAAAAVTATPHETARPWMDRLGLLDLLPATETGIARYLVFSVAAGADPRTRTRGVLTLLLASPDYPLR
jgi:uncharacterized protein (DUF1800 family)